jgi:hypothetical protein
VQDGWVLLFLIAISGDTLIKRLVAHHKQKYIEIAYPKNAELPLQTNDQKVIFGESWNLELFEISLCKCTKSSL